MQRERRGGGGARALKIKIKKERDRFKKKEKRKIWERVGKHWENEGLVPKGLHYGVFFVHQ